MTLHTYLSSSAYFKWYLKLAEDEPGQAWLTTGRAGPSWKKTGSVQTSSGCFSLMDSFVVSP